MDDQRSYYNIRYSFDPERAAVWKAIVENIQYRFICDNSAILDIACGYGDFINQVASPSKTAIDLEDVKQYLDESIEFVNSDVGCLGEMKGQQFSTIFCSNLLEHLESSEGKQLITDIHALLKPQGRVIFLQPNFRLCSKRYFDDYTHKTIYTDESLCGLLKANKFNIIARKAGYLPFSMNGILPKSYYLTKIFLLMKSPLIGSQMLVVAEKN